MAHNGKARRPYEYHADLPALTRPRVEPRREPLAVPTRQLALKSRLRDLRRHHRRRLPSLDEHPRRTRNHHLHRHVRLGSRRSIVMTAGIISHSARSKIPVRSLGGPGERLYIVAEG